MSKQAFATLQTFAALRGIKKAVDETAIRAMIGPGEYENLDVTLRLSVPKLIVGEDYPTKLVQKAKPWNLVAILLSKLNGVTIDSVVAEAIAADKAQVTKIKKSAEAAMAKIKAPTTSTAKGPVRLPEGASLKIVNTDVIFQLIGEDGKVTDSSRQLTIDAG